MKKSIKVVIAAGIVLGFAFVLLGFQSELRAADPPDKVTISVIKDKKSAVEFPHKAHQETLKGKCGNCHVKADGGDGLKPELKAKPASMAEALKHPFHTQCKGCHVESKKAGKEKAPTKCTECHK